MKCTIMRLTAMVLFVYLTAVNAFAKDLIPVGEVVGLELKDRQVVVAGFDKETGAEAQAAGLKSGDIIQKIDDFSITCPEDIRTALTKSDGTVSVQISRNGEVSHLTLNPRITPEGPKLGLYLRHGVTGIGTVTWYDPDTGTFGTLGHGVNDGSGKLLPLESGHIYRATVMSVKKGKIGQPGQLMGAIQSPEPVGSVSRNTPQGVFGSCDKLWEGTPIPVAKAGEVKTGPAIIRSTVSGDTVREYSVKILKVYPKSRGGGRNLLLKVTDPALLSATGGIVQGMGVSYNKDNQWNP